MSALSTNHGDATALPLSEVRAGSSFQVCQLVGPACRQLREIGFCENASIKKIANGRNLICSIYGCRVALSRELAKQVLVLPV